MANTRQSTKRAAQTIKKQKRNTLVRSQTKTAVSKAIDAISKKDLSIAKDAYMLAIKKLAKAASKGSIPKKRADRKISRLTLLAKKALPQALAK